MIGEEGSGRRRAKVGLALALSLAAVVGITSYLSGVVYPVGNGKRKTEIIEKTEYRIEGNDVFRRRNTMSEYEIVVTDSVGNLIPLQDYINGRVDKIWGGALYNAGIIQIEAGTQIADIKGQANDLEDSLLIVR